MTALGRLWRAIFGPHQRASREVPPADLPPPDPDVQHLHAWQHEIVNRLQNAQLRDDWSQRQRRAWHPDLEQNS